MSFKKFIKNVLVAGSILVFSFFFFALSAKAASGIQISPLTYNYEVKAGGSQSAKVIIKNLNTLPLDYVLETEVINQVTDDGAPSFGGSGGVGLNEQVGTTSLADWIDFTDPEEGVLESGKDIEVNFTINVPVGAEPGGHYAAVFAKEVKKNAAGQTQVGVASRVGTLILVSVPGATTKNGQISSFTSPKFVWKGPVDFQMQFTNNGTVHYDSKGEVKIKSLFGNVSTVDMGTHTVLPSLTRNYNGSWLKRFPFGRYILTASALDGNGQAQTTTTVLWAIPLEIVIPGIIALILLIIIIRYIRGHFKFVPEPQAPTPSNEQPAVPPTQQTAAPTESPVEPPVPPSNQPPTAS